MMQQPSQVGIVTKHLGSVNKAILMVVSLLLTGTLKVPTLPIQNHKKRNPMPNICANRNQPWDDPTCSRKFFMRG